MEAVCCPKCRFILHGINSQKISIIDTAVKTSQKTVLTVLRHYMIPVALRGSK
jgi:hypothetical protein